MQVRTTLGDMDIGGSWEGSGTSELVSTPKELGGDEEIDGAKEYSVNNSEHPSMDAGLVVEEHVTCETYC